MEEKNWDRRSARLLEKEKKQLMKRREKLSTKERADYRAVVSATEALVKNIEVALDNHGGDCKCEICWELHRVCYVMELINSSVEFALPMTLIRE